MAVCKQSAEELIQDIFSPVVAVLCSDPAEAICRKNNLSFVELLQPFCRLTTEATIRDPSNTNFSVRNVRITVRDMRSQPLPLPVVKKMMNDSVSNTQGESSIKSSFTVGSYTLTFCTTTPWFEAYRSVFFQVFYPAEHEFTNRFIGCIFVVSSSENDPVNQLSTLVQEQIHFQQNSAHSIQWFCPNIYKYFVLLHDVAVEDLNKAENIYQSMKSSYGATQCHLLQINSRGVTKMDEEQEDYGNFPDPWKQFLTPAADSNFTQSINKNGLENEEKIDADCPNILDNIPNVAENSVFHPLSPDSVDSVTPTERKVFNEEDWINASANHVLPNDTGSCSSHGQCLSVSDLDRIRIFIQDLCVQGLIPYAERQIRILSEQVANRKGIHRSILSATKKIFGGNKPIQQGLTNSGNSVVYSQDAPELQVRKLGDLAFMFQLYEVAYNAYHSAKRDFANDQAWLYYAGALEMAALAIFLQGSSAQRAFPFHYLDNAITTYLNSCKLPQYATRATLLSTEALKSKGMYSDAAQQFMKMTGEDSDLRSALLLEQAALCFLHSKPAMVRKYAFHIILAGHRFSKSGQRKHALRAYTQAWEMYQNRGWDLASDHTIFIIGKQSLNLKKLDEAWEAFESLLAPGSQQPAVHQTTYLKEYLFVMKQLLNEKSEEKTSLPVLPLPIIDGQSTKVLLGHEVVETSAEKSAVGENGSFAIGDEDPKCWAELEERCLSYATGSRTTLLRPHLQCLTDKTDNSVRPQAVIGESLTVQLSLNNPIRVQIVLSNVHLLWEFFPENANATQTESLSNEITTGKSALLNEVVETHVIPEIRLDGLQEKKIQLCIQPQQIGTLHITGISFTLQPAQGLQNGGDSDDHLAAGSLAIRGKRNVEVKGPRLNSTVLERSRKSYAPDFRLRPCVVHHMPKLRAKFANFATELLCGEVKMVRVKLSNTGQCGLRRLLVTSTTPDLFAIGDILESDSDDTHPTQVYREVPSDGRSRSPVTVERQRAVDVTEILFSNGTPVELESGSSLTVPLWIRGPDSPGQHHLDFLFYYETFEIGTKLKYRLLQHTFTVTTLPSLSLQAECQRSWLTGTEDVPNSNSLVVSLQVLHSVKPLENSDAKIGIFQVTGTSSCWCIDSISRIGTEGITRLSPAEMVYVNLRCSTYGSKASGSNIAVFSQVPFSSTEIDGSSLPCSEFSLHALRNAGGRLGIVKNHSEITDNNVPSLETASLVNLSLTVLWKTTVQRNGQLEEVMGQHHVTVERLASVTPAALAAKFAVQNRDEKKESYKSLLSQKLAKSALLHQTHITHCFQEKKLAVVPVTLVLHNCSKSYLRVKVDLIQSEARDLQETTEVCSFTWVGHNLRKVSLEAGETTKVMLRATFGQPGTYNLANLKVMASLGDMEPVLQDKLPPSLLVITDKS